jgi:hypothetical protein
MFRRLSPLLVLCCLAAACAGVGANNPSTEESASPTNTVFWERYRIAGLEVEGYTTIADMSLAADSVVTAHVTGVEPGRVFQGDVAEDRVYYARVILEVEQDLHGKAETSTIPMELLLPQVFNDDGFEKAIAELDAAIPKDRILVFLREKNDPDPGVYRPVNSVGLFASTDRSVIDTPLSAEGLTSGLYQDELAGIKTFDDLVALVAGAG